MLPYFKKIPGIKESRIKKTKYEIKKLLRRIILSNIKRELLIHLLKIVLRLKHYFVSNPSWSGITSSSHKNKILCILLRRIKLTPKNLSNETSHRLLLSPGKGLLRQTI